MVKEGQEGFLKAVTLALRLVRGGELSGGWGGAGEGGISGSGSSTHDTRPGSDSLLHEWRVPVPSRKAGLGAGRAAEPSNNTGTSPGGNEWGATKVLEQKQDLDRLLVWKNHFVGSRRARRGSQAGSRKNGQNGPSLWSCILG